MVKLMVREAVLVLLSGLFARYAVPWMIGLRHVQGLFPVGLLMALSFMALYAMAALAGNKMPARVRAVLSVVGLLLAFGPALPHSFGWATAGVLALPGGLLAGLGALKGRGEGALAALYAYTFPMLGVRWLLLPMVGAAAAIAVVALWTGAFYMCLRGLVRLYLPESVEGNAGAGPLIHRPVPDQVVGLVEAAARRRARPYATLPGRALDHRAISVQCPPEEADAVARRIQEFLAGSPFTAAIGEAVEDGVEVVVRSEAEHR